MPACSFDELADKFARCAEPETFLRVLRDTQVRGRLPLVFESRLWARRRVLQMGAG